MPTPSERDAARRALAVLCSMRGASGKLAQLADFVDPSWAPPGERAELEATLADLRLRAPEPLPFKRVERLLREAWGGKLSDHLADLEREPAAMASAGQVHRGELDDGRAVAVKLLHPGVEDVLRAELVNLSLLAALATTVLPGIDARALAAELRERTLEECDLEHEAQSQRLFARAYRGHPFIHVPAPVTELARDDVLVGEWVEGTAFSSVCELEAQERDRYGEILARFHVGAMFHTGAFHADPHPGNHLLLADGRVAFVDFGSVGRAEPAWLDGMLRAADAADAGDGRDFTRRLSELGYLAGFDEDDEAGAGAGAGLLDALLAASGGVLDAQELRIDPERVSASLSEGTAQARRRVRELMLRHGRLPPRDVLAGRMGAGMVSMLMQLRASARWNDYARALRGLAGPRSELGIAEEAFWASRGRSRRA